MRRAYAVLLRLYPADHREVFGPEMLHAFESAAEERRGQGARATLRFLAAELTGLVTGAAAEWTAKLSGKRAIVGAGNLELVDAERRVKLLVDRMVHAIATHDFEGARSYSRQEREEREKLRALRTSVRSKSRCPV